MQTIRIAWRNVFRNRRRTVMAMASIAVGVVALILISGFVATVRHALETEGVRDEGHVQIMAKDYLDLGSAYPGRFAVGEWRAIAERIMADPELAGAVAVVAPRLQLAGIVGNARSGASRSFLGEGLDPTLHARMQQWDGFRLNLRPRNLGLDPAAPELAVVGLGLAQQLQLCKALAVADCTDHAVLLEPEGPPDEAIAGLAVLAQASEAGGSVRHAGLPVIDLLAPSAEGLANARSVWVSAASPQARRQADNSYVAMDLSTAQSLVFDGDDRVSHVMIQFRDNGYAEQGLRRLRTLLSDHPQPLDIMPLAEFNDTFTRVVTMFRIMQIFVGIVVCLIILFMVANTMAIIVMERVTEIGTLRALGESRRGIWRLFLAEGGLLGAISATAGVLVAWGAVLALNNSGLGFSTPTSREPIPVRILFTEVPATIAAIWLTITFVAGVSSLFPALRAARFKIVDALRFA